MPTEVMRRATDWSLEMHRVACVYFDKWRAERKSLSAGTEDDA